MGTTRPSGDVPCSTRPRSKIAVSSRAHFVPGSGDFGWPFSARVRCLRGMRGENREWQQGKACDGRLIFRGEEIEIHNANGECSRYRYHNGLTLAGAELRPSNNASSHFPLPNRKACCAWAGGTCNVMARDGAQRVILEVSTLLPAFIRDAAKQTHRPAGDP